MKILTVDDDYAPFAISPENGSSPIPVVPRDAGTGGSIVPLSIAFFVDAASASTGTPDGSIANPFRTMQAAVDAIAVQGAGFIMVVSAVGGADFVVPAGVAYIQVRGLGAGPSGFPGIGPVTIAIGATAELDFQNVGLSTPGDWSIPTGSGVTFTNCVLPSILIDAPGCDVRLIGCSSTASFNYGTLSCWGALSLAGGPWTGSGELPATPLVDDVSERAAMTSSFTFGLRADLDVLGRLDDVVPSTIIGDDADEPVSQGFRYTLARNKITAPRTLSLFNPITVPAGQAWSQWIDVYPQTSDVIIAGPGGIPTIYTIAAGNQALRLVFFFPAGGPSWTVQSVQQLT